MFIWLMVLILLVTTNGCAPIQTPLHNKNLTGDVIESIQFYEHINDKCVSRNLPKSPVEYHKDYFENYILFKVKNSDKGALFYDIKLSKIVGDHVSGRRELPFRDWKTNHPNRKIVTLYNYLLECNADGL